MRYKKENRFYNFCYRLVTPFTSITIAQRVKRAIKHTIVYDNIFNLREFDEAPVIKVIRKNQYEYTIKIQNVGNKHDTIINAHMALSGALRGRLAKYEVGIGHDTDGGNFVEFELRDTKVNWQFQPEEVDDFKNDFGMVKIDNKLVVNITKNAGWIISGSTGSGKSTMLLSTLAQMLTFKNGKNKPDLYIVDFKNGELARLAKNSKLPAKNFCDGTNSDELLAMFEHIDKLMYQRQQSQIKTKSLTVTAKDLGFSPIYVVLEEFGSGLALLDKKTQDQIKKYVGKIAMQGRSSLICLVVIAQQASVQGTGLSTSVINQLSNKVLLGQATATERAYLMANFDLPVKAWEKGSGKGYFYSDSLIEPYEFTGAFPMNKPDNWLFKVLNAEINKIYR